LLDRAFVHGIAQPQQQADTALRARVASALGVVASSEKTGG
jgi:hypothetical protein